MELADAIRSRRAIRSYTDAAVGRSVIERLIDAAILAPSAMNLQPWAFAILRARAGLGLRETCKRVVAGQPRADILRAFDPPHARRPSVCLVL